MLLSSNERASRERLVDAYNRTNRWRERTIAGLNAAFEGLWLGVLDREDLSRLDESFYDDVRQKVDGKEYAYADDGWNLSGLKDWEKAAIVRHFPERGRVVVTGAGGGREVFALLEQGFDATGYEPHPGFAAAGADLLARLGYPERLFPSSRDVFPAGADACDAVLVGWGSYMLIPSRARRVAFLRSARASLPEGAPILLSFFLRQDDLRYLDVVTGTANVVRRLRRRGPIDIGDALSPAYVHYFTRDEIEAELVAAGFHIVEFEAQPYGHAVAVAD